MKSEGQRPNRLIDEKSPYLLQHAYNPVDWYPYGPEAFEAARREDKAIFLSIGYSSCHWCHVMERESFEDPAIAAVMNEHYINIKVDREERPDVDQIYMLAAMHMTRQGGWPLNVWLDHELRPFYAGTYFPPEGRWGRPGFPSVLQSLAEVFRTRREEISNQGDRLLEMMAEVEPASGEGAGAAGLEARGCEQLARSYDDLWGGFGHAPKFPRPVSLWLIAHRLARHEDEGLRKIHDHSLEMMWRGGIYDHVGGGFARYSTDERWLVPHFEKMLYDNAQLVESYLDGWLLGGDESHLRCAKDVLRFVQREMLDGEGCFYSAQDADSEGVEGKFYLFSRAEMEEVLGEEAQKAIAALGVCDSGNFEGSNVLHWPRSVGETAEELGLVVDELFAHYERWRAALYPWREKRIRPQRDEKQITSWNGLMIHAFARAGALLEDPSLIEVARRAAARIEAKCRGDGGELLRRHCDGEARFEASLDDHAALAWGHLGLFEATGEAAQLEAALALVEAVEERFLDGERGGYFFAAQRDDLVVRLKDSEDNAVPSGNGLLALVLARLGSVLDREDLRDRARASIASFRVRLGRLPEAFPCLVMAATELDELPATLCVLGKEPSSDFTKAVAVAHATLKPGRVVVPVLDSERESLQELGVPLGGKEAEEGTIQALLCEDGACRKFAL